MLRQHLRTSTTTVRRMLPVVTVELVMEAAMDPVTELAMETSTNTSTGKKTVLKVQETVTNLTSISMARKTVTPEMEIATVKTVKTQPHKNPER